MTQEKVCEIIGFLTSTYEGNSSIKVYTSGSPFYLSLKGVFEVEDGLLHYEEGDIHLWIECKSINAIDF